MEKKYVLPEGFQIFLPDTNVFLHDSDSLKKLGKNLVLISHIVIEELDEYKKTSGELGFHARNVLRYFENIQTKESIEDCFSIKGVPLFDKGGMIRFLNNTEISLLVSKTYKEKKNDNRILSALINAEEDYSTGSIVLISKDLALRQKARCLGIVSQDYQNDKVNVSDIKNIEIPCQDSILQSFYEKGKIDIKELDYDTNKIPNYFVLKPQKGESIPMYHSSNIASEIKNQKVFSLSSKNNEQLMAIDALFNPDIPLVALTGKAGTGKTLLAIAVGLKLFMDKNFDQILISSAAVPLSNKELGFLPGDSKDKVSPYMMGLFTNLSYLKTISSNKTQIDKDLENGNIVIQALAFIRGASLHKVFFIVDEGQNITPHEIKTIITRAGEGTKIIICGDIDQIDKPELDAESNGLSNLIVKMRGQKLFAHIHFEKSVRSQLAELASNILWY